MTLKNTPRPQLLLLLIPAAFLLQGCAEKAAIRSQQTRQYAIDQGGLASVCDAPKVSPVDGKETPVAMSVNSAGGRCSISVSEGSKPYGAGLLSKRPEHGTVYIHTVGDDTRVDYIPRPGFAGSDAFAVTLVPGAAVLQVAVTVTK